MTGGIITGNTAADGAGVNVNPTGTGTSTLKIGAAAQIAANNAVYLEGTTNVKVTSALTSGTPIILVPYVSSTDGHGKDTSVTTAGTNNTEVLVVRDGSYTFPGSDTDILGPTTPWFTVQSPAGTPNGAIKIAGTRTLGLWQD
jgi:hypothetical protein